MWVGMGMYKQSWMTRVTHWPLYLSLSVLCIGLSTVVTLLNIHWHWDARFSQYLGLPLLHLISFPQALTYMLLLICVYRRLTHSRIFSMFINVGRMSLTAYLLESVFAHVIFYGHHGYYGQFSYAQQIPIVILISIVIMGFAQYWMYYFQRGPMEFLLHSYSGIPDE